MFSILIDNWKKVLEHHLCLEEDLGELMNILTVFFYNFFNFLILKIKLSLKHYRRESRTTLNIFHTHQ